MPARAEKKEDAGETPALREDWLVVVRALVGWRFFVEKMPARRRRSERIGSSSFALLAGSHVFVEKMPARRRRS